MKPLAKEYGDGLRRSALAGLNRPTLELHHLGIEP